MKRAVVLALFAGARLAAAHSVGLSRGDYRADGATVSAEIVFARPELAGAIPTLDADRDGAVSAAEIAAARDAIAAWAERGVVVRAGDDPCTGTLGAATATEQDGVALTMRHRCPRTVASYEVRLDLLASLSLGHRHVATLTSAATVVRGVLFERQPELAVIGAAGGTADAAGGAPSPFRAGVAQALGVDRLLLLVLLIAGAPSGALAARLLAFALAHSLTFAIAALGYWSPPVTSVGAAGALAILVVGADALRRQPRRARSAAFVAGLLDGFCRAAALPAVARAATPGIVAVFHAGMEAGQLGWLLTATTARYAIRGLRRDGPGLGATTRAAFAR